MRIGILLTTFLIAAVSPTVLACSCMNRSGDVEHDVLVARMSASAVILATAIEVKNEQDNTANFGSVAKQRVIWAVDRGWKGDFENGDRLESNTATECCSCGMKVSAGKSYLLYLHGNEPFELSICSLSTRAESAKEQIHVLDARKAANN